MLAKTKMQKLEVKLQEVQKGCRSRMLSMNDIQDAIELAENAVKDVRQELRHLVRFEYLPFEVAKAYKYPAEGTGLTVKFNKAGKAIEATVGRDYVRNDGTKNRLAVDYSDMQDFIESELGVAQPGYDNPEAYQKYQKLFLVVSKESGFNQHLTRPL